MHRRGYFFTKKVPLARILPGYFQQSYWRMTFGVTNPRSTEHQVNHALKVLDNTPLDQRLFLFLNVSAIHGPNHMFLPGARKDSVDSQRAALRYADGELGRLFARFRERDNPVFAWLFQTMAPPTGKMAMRGTGWHMRRFGMSLTGSLSSSLVHRFNPDERRNV